ncbi:MAG TPA: wax ester/triacylglycerol synthase family O-acyltransferase [Candidatus Binatia bacterium]|nr:wax ester/triacylglycerol synthase family O-acyltransferase [Candidatus Binatia bacterium]
MAYAHFERLSALDTVFLDIEDRNTHMHVGAVSLFDAPPLLGADGLVDMDRIRRVIQVGLHRVPRYQQRLAYVPLFGSPVWVDDEHFNLSYHLRHVSLPRPGDERLLKRLTGRIMSQQLDRGKPLWELWVVEGVEGNRVALITKAHHCMIDGVGSVELSSALMRATPDIERRLDNPPHWLPRPAPTPFELVLSEIGRRAGEPLGMLRAAGRALTNPGTSLRAARDAVIGVEEAVSAGLHPTSATPLNVPIGPHRRFDWLEMDLAAVKEVKQRLGGTINDVVLAVVAGALGRFLHARGLNLKGIDFRAMLPVSVRDENERESMGNRVTMMVTPLPLDERAPRQRLQRVIDATGALKRSHQALGVKTLEEVGDSTFTTLFSAFVRLAAVTHPYNIVVTNVPGPQFQSYFLGAPMRAVYPLVPLYTNQALGIALFSYNGRLFWGFNADWDALPDLHELADATSTEFNLLRDAAAAISIGTATKPLRTPRRKRTPARGSFGASIARAERV